MIFYGNKDFIIFRCYFYCNRRVILTEFNRIIQKIIKNLLDFASPDDIVWFDHGKRKYYSILDDKLGDFFKDYLPILNPKTISDL